MFKKNGHRCVGRGSSTRVVHNAHREFHPCFSVFLDIRVTILLELESIVSTKFLYCFYTVSEKFF